MALSIANKTVTVNGLSRTGCYIMIIPYETTGSNTIPCDRNIWSDRTDYDSSPTKGTIPVLNEIPNSFGVDILTAPADCSGNTVYDKNLYWINEQCKAAILAANPSWVSDDIEIVDLP